MFWKNEHRTLTLLSFHLIQEAGNGGLCFGQIGYARKGEWSFSNYSHWRNFRKMLSLYFRKVPKGQPVTLIFQHQQLHTTTNAQGFFQIPVTEDKMLGKLKAITLDQKAVEVNPDLYAITPQEILPGQPLVISDMDDTLIQSFIYNKWLKIKAMLFTKVEKRLVIESMEALVQQLEQQNAAFFYVSNSEQNLYPLIYRFLRFNDFPSGALFLKQLRKARHLLTGKKKPKGTHHKVQTVKILMEAFPDHQWWLLGDNTQQDPMIYSAIAKEHPQRVKGIVIRKVVDKESIEQDMLRIAAQMAAQEVPFYYGETFEGIL